ncbi:MAG: Bug family tripartite tricarboxylate transporter substrate binding protein [Beijerinckiaceae bacterium]
MQNTAPPRASRAIVSVLALSGACLAATGAMAQDNVAAFYKDKTITIIVGSTPGGGYDTYARLLSRHIGKHLPGSPKAVVQNMPGAGSNRAAGYVADVAPKDGTMIAAVYSGQPLGRVLLERSKLSYDPAKLNYLGSASQDTYVCLVRKDAPVKKYTDVFKNELVLGSSSPNASTGYMGILQRNVLGAKIKLVVGYRGSRQIFAAIEKGETQGVCGINWTSIQSTYKRFIDSGLAHVLVQEDEKGVAEANKAGIPRTFDHAKTDEAKKILRTIYLQGRFARPYFVAGGVPAERVSALRKAFLDSWNDKALQAEAAKMRLDIEPLSGDELQKLVLGISKEPDSFMDKVKDAIKYNLATGK